jgi:nicotinamide phosphoribosyltransferase
MMTVENTCPKCFWLTNAVESLLTHVWYPSTVATLSHTTVKTIASWVKATGGDGSSLPFMLHDFGYRGASSHESAAIGGLAHLVNSMGTDTLPALLLAQEYYGAQGAVAFSVPATEHSVMTARGENGEFDVVQQLLDEYPTGILSVVADSYNVYRFVELLGDPMNEYNFRAQIMAREGKFVVRPDSITKDHPQPGALCVALLHSLWRDFGGTTNDKGFRVLDPHIGLIWGDGIDPIGINEILRALRDAGFAAENMVFGMGGGLLQKVNRDTQRFAFKCSAQKRDGVWYDIQKRPLDTSKTSKAGRLMLAPGLVTVPEGAYHEKADQLVTVFENGELVREWTFDEVRARAAR